MTRIEQGSNPPRTTANIDLPDDDLKIDAKLNPLDPTRSDDWGQAIIAIGTRDNGATLWAYRPEPLEELASVLNRVAGQMRADRTAHQLDQAAGRQAVA